MKRETTSQAIERRSGQILDEYDLAEDSANQAIVDVSTFGGDPVTQLNLKKSFLVLFVSVRKHVATLLGA